MKVKQENEFKPITITIETYEEACELWHRLDLPSVDVKKLHNTNYEYIKADKNNMWLKFNDVFEPKRK